MKRCVAKSRSICLITRSCSRKYAIRTKTAHWMIILCVYSIWSRWSSRNIQKKLREEQISWSSRCLLVYQMLLMLVPFFFWILYTKSLMWLALRWVPASHSTDIFVCTSHKTTRKVWATLLFPSLKPPQLLLGKDRFLSHFTEAFPPSSSSRETRIYVFYAFTLNAFKSIPDSFLAQISWH